MKYIEEKGAIYCIRVKSRLTFYIHNYGEIVGYTKDVPPKEKEEQFQKNRCDFILYDL